MNKQIVKIWIENEISSIEYKKEMGLILYITADAKISVLKKFYDEFNLDFIEEELIWVILVFFKFSVYLPIDSAGSNSESNCVRLSA